MITDEAAELEVESEPPKVRLARLFKKFWPGDPAFMGSSAKKGKYFHFSKPQLASSSRHMVFGLAKISKTNWLFFGYLTSNESPRKVAFLMVLS